MKRFILILMFVFVFAGIGAAQTTDSEYDLMQRAEMVAEIKKLRSENASKDKIIEAKDAQIADLKRLDQTQEARIADLKESIKYRTDAGNLVPQIEKLYETRINDYRTENERLRTENEKLRKSRDRRSVLGILGGIAAGVLLF
jgi:hypothetical protein